MKKILMFLTIFLFSFTLIACLNNEEPEKEIIDLPNRYQSINQTSDETIYISANPNGVINSMKVTKHQRDTNFNYYETYGQFLDNGNLNISYGNANIIIEGDKALAPSLKETKNFFYMLNLNYDYYENELPFLVSVKYYLNDEETNYENLQGSYGEINIEINITANPLAKDYFKNFSAQVQIPIDLTKATILEHNGSMADIITGQKSTIAYMVFPNSSQTIHLKLKGNNFSFAGIDISYQELDVFDLIGSFIELDSFDIEMFENLDVLLQTLNGLNANVKPLFASLDLMQDLTNIEQFLALNAMIEQLNSPSFNMGLNISKNMLKPDLENKIVYETQFDTLNTTILYLISLLTSEYNTFSQNIPLLLEFKALIENIKDYPEFYKDFEKIIENINHIVLMSNHLSEFNLNDFKSNKELYTNILKDLSNKGLEVEILFNNLIKNMYTLPLDLYPLVTNLETLAAPLTSIYTILEISSNLYTTLNTYVDLVEGIKTLDGFSSTQYVDMFLVGLKSNDLNNPGLIEGLNSIIQHKITEDDINNLFLLNDLFTSSTNIRPIDEILLAFIEIDNHLFTKDEDELFSFYDAMDKINLIASILDLIPTIKENDVTSFLHRRNSTPEQVSFILRISGF